MHGGARPCLSLDLPGRRRTQTSRRCLCMLPVGVALRARCESATRPSSGSLACLARCHALSSRLSSPLVSCGSPASSKSRPLATWHLPLAITLGCPVALARPLVDSTKLLLAPQPSAASLSTTPSVTDGLRVLLLCPLHCPSC